MSLGTRVMEASRALYARATERSLLPAALAVDTAARRRYPRQRSNRDRYARFVRDNMRLLTMVWLGAPADACRIYARHPDLNAGSPETGFELEDALYHYVRSEIIREQGLTPALAGVARGIAEVEVRGGSACSLRFSHRLVEGLLAAVVLGPENAHERTPEPVPLYLQRERYWVNRLWGRRDYFCAEVLNVDLRAPTERGVPPVTIEVRPRPA